MNLAWRCMYINLFLILKQKKALADTYNIFERKRTCILNERAP